MAKLFGIVPMSGDGAEKDALRNSQEMAQNYQKMYDQFMPRGMAELWNLYTNPNTPFHQAQMNGFTANTLRGYQAADGKLQQALAHRGIGRSNYTGNALGALWSQYGQALANARQQQMGELDQRRQATLQALMGYAGNAGQNAISAWGQTYNQGNQRSQGMVNGLMDYWDQAKQYIPVA